MTSRPHPSQLARQATETAVILIAAGIVHEFWRSGPVSPQSIPAKLVTLMEVTLAFFTVIFLLSDFISLKDALRSEGQHE